MNIAVHNVVSLDLVNLPPGLKAELHAANAEVPVFILLNLE
jgi:hypothetical protein